MTDKNYFTIERAREIGETLGVDWSRFGVQQFRSKEETHENI
jgi:hypothetical protein